MKKFLFAFAFVFTACALSAQTKPSSNYIYGLGIDNPTDTFSVYLATTPILWQTDCPCDGTILAKAPSYNGWKVRPTQITPTQKGYKFFRQFNNVLYWFVVDSYESHEGYYWIKVLPTTITATNVSTLTTTVLQFSTIDPPTDTTAAK